MSLKRNIFASYISQIYILIVGIVLLPIYIKYMGAEAYGLVGFFTMLQAWFGLLDLGLTPTIGRETARYHGGVLPALDFRQLFRALSVIFTVIAVLGGGSLFVLSGYISTEWLKVENLAFDEVEIAVKIMAVSVALRWMCGLYRGVVTGAECLVWLSWFSALVATLRFIVVLPVMWIFGFTPFVFFSYQLCVACFEIAGLGFKAFRLLPSKNILPRPIGWSFGPVKPVLKFALTIAFTASVWVFVTQTDKLILSGVLSLENYGFFTLAVLAASGIMVIGGPISSAIMPRMARLQAEGLHEELVKVYRQSTQLVVIIAGSAAVTLVVAAEPLLLAWTGNQYIAAEAAPILKLYALGNGLLAVGAFPYYLQYAKGNLRYHFVGSTIMVIVLIPSIIWAASHFGGVGAGYVWLLINAIYFLVWVPYVHYKLVPSLHFKWVTEDVIKVIFPAVALTALLMPSVRFAGRFENLFYVICLACGVMGVTLVCSASARAIFKERML